MTALWNHSFVRFLLVGIVNTMVGLSIIYLLLNGAGIGYWPATLIGNGIGAAVSYTLNRSFTFGSRTEVGRSLWKFCAVIAVCYFFSYATGLGLSHLALSVAGRDGASWSHNAAVLFGTGLYTVSNYLGHKYFTFRQAPVSIQAGETNEI